MAEVVLDLSSDFQVTIPSKHTILFDTNRFNLPLVVPESFCDPVLGLSGNYDMLPWHSLERGGTCLLVDDPIRRHTKKEGKEHD